MNKSFHNVLKSVSVLPALLVLPAVADTYTLEPPFIDDYVTVLTEQLQDVLPSQNATGFEVGKITIGTDMSSVGEHSLGYGVSSTDEATQYMKLEQASIPAGTADISFHVPAGSTYGLTSSKLGMLTWAYGEHIAQADGSAILSIADIAKNTGSFLEDWGSLMGIEEVPWFLYAMDTDLANGKIEEGYITTSDSFVIDGNYGNTLGEVLLSFENSLVDGLNNLDYVQWGSYIPDAIVRGMFGFSMETVSQMTEEARAAAVHNYFQQFADGVSNLDFLKLRVGEIAVDGGDVKFENSMGIRTSKLDITNGANVLIDENASVGVILDNISITYNGQYDTEEPVTSTQNYTVQGATISGANTHVTIADNATFTIAGTQLDVTDGASLVNNGTLNLMTTDNTFDEDLTGNGTLVIYENATVNVGSHNITQGTITLNGTMNATVRDSENAQFTANTFDGNGTLNLAFADAGTYHVFGNDVFDEEGVCLSGIDVNSSLYNLDWINGGKDLKVTLKSASNIETDNDLSGNAAATLVGLAGSSSAALNDLAVTMQEKLAEGTASARNEVEQVVAAINPGTESVSKTIANSVQNTLTDLASARLAILSAGRSGGDESFVSKGVWVQGLYNKTKMNDHFNGYTRGIAIGLDGRVSHDVSLGAGYAFNRSDVVSNGHDIDIDSNTLFVYGQYKPSGWFTNAFMNYTWSDYSDNGDALFVTSEYNSDSFGAAVAGGYEFDFGLSLGMGVRYMHVNGERYRNSLGVITKLDSVNYLTPMFGTKWGLNISATDSFFIRPEVRYALKYDVICDEAAATVMMPGSAAYTLLGDRLPRVGNEFGLGLMMKFRDVAFSANYDIEIRPDYTSQTGMLKFRYEF